ncbi:coiled-coil domain-containing glutamate-rich protein 1 isoform X2 [Brassica rapa]|uniref:coiled-coil domain-containing glutamate-rich protein 1 isoform X2 n=1 Tax=Brassica campestris TaxID=3711 RepID=UPI00142D7A52|nr:coiled-coil domain-containing glutamate-rich protein 1 isoform X2 [Brassica rapa]
MSTPIRDSQLETSSADPLCLRRDSTRAPTITEVLEVEKKNNGVVTTMFGFSEEFKHLVNPTHPDDKNFDSVVQLVQQGYKVKKSDWEQGFVDVFLQQKTLVDKAGQKTKMYSKTSKEQTQDEEEEQVEAGAEFGDGDKERETSKINEGQTLEEGEEEQMEADTEVEEPVQIERQNEEEEIRIILLMAHVMKIKICFVFMLKGSM